MKLPRLWRKKRNGKYYGNWLATIAGDDVSLGTKDAELARQRLPKALKGAREFESDAAAAAAVMPDIGGAGGGETTLLVEQGTIPSPPPAPPAPALEQPPPASSPPPANDNDARAEAEATNAAAQETAAAGGETAGGSVAPDMVIPPEALEWALPLAAGVIVEAQFMVQAWLIKRQTGKIAGTVPADSLLRKGAVDAWVAQFKRWFPEMQDVPPWVLALALPAVGSLVQLQGATDPPKKPDETAAPAAQAAA